MPPPIWVPFPPPLCSHMMAAYAGAYMLLPFAQHGSLMTVLQKRYVDIGTRCKGAKIAKNMVKTGKQFAV